MASFSVKGPFDVPCTTQKGGRSIAKGDIKMFWDEHDDIAGERGCYIFGFRASKGSKPTYVGKATKSFKQEIFAPHKLNKYSQGFNDRIKGTPIMFFICLDRTKGPVNKSAINDAESYLIQTSLVANKKLTNEKKTALEPWGIRGIIRSHGAPSKAATELRKCLNL